MKTTGITKILVPLDFSDIALEALETAAGIARRQNAELILLHVIEFLQYPMTEYRATYMHQAVAEMNKAEKDNLQNKASEIKNKYQIEATTCLLMGNLRDTIIETAVNKEIDMIVMGSHGASGLRGYFIGTNAYDVIKKAPCPVLTIPAGQQKKEFRDIIFPVRLVTQALNKYEAVREIACKNRATLHILEIIPDTGSEETKAQLKKQLDPLLNGLDEDSIVYMVVTAIAANDPAKETLREAERINADLIVITASPDHNLKELLIGPYVQQIVNHAKYPVLSVRPSLSVQTIEKLKKHATHEWEFVIPGIGLAA
jgi:nucleotide-binding universal stress UspA family protein